MKKMLVASMAIVLWLYFGSVDTSIAMSAAKSLEWRGLEFELISNPRGCIGGFINMRFLKKLYAYEISTVEKHRNKYKLTQGSMKNPYLINRKNVRIKGNIYLRWQRLLQILDSISPYESVEITFSCLHDLKFLESPYDWRATSAGVYRVEIPAEKEANINDFKKDQLNFIYRFSKALANKDYKEAEIFRVRWISFLKDWEDYFEPNSREQLAIRYDINCLSKIIGLTDPDLMDLRIEYRIAKWNKDWNTALKIQQLINMKLEEIQKLPPPTSEKFRKLNPRDRHELYI